MSSKMEQIIDEIEEYIDGCKFQALSSTRIIVNKEELEELIAELRAKTPEEIKRYQKIISNKEAILADAQAKADQIIAQAQIQTTELVSEHQIMQQAYAQANEVVMLATRQAQEILDDATNEANSLRMNIMEYADQQLHAIEEILSGALTASKTHYTSLMTSLQQCSDVVIRNRAELFPQHAPETEKPKEIVRPVEKNEEKKQQEKKTQGPDITDIPASDEKISEE